LRALFPVSNEVKNETIILAVVVYECETLPLTLKVEHRLRVTANRALMRIFGPKRKEVGKHCITRSLI
jgi:hypothetical protein